MCSEGTGRERSPGMCSEGGIFEDSTKEKRYSCRERMR